MSIRKTLREHLKIKCTVQDEIKKQKSKNAIWKKVNTEQYAKVSVHLHNIFIINICHVHWLCLPLIK
jgi:hypothetical protein